MDCQQSDEIQEIQGARNGLRRGRTLQKPHVPLPVLRRLLPRDRLRPVLPELCPEPGGGNGFEVFQRRAQPADIQHLDLQVQSVGNARLHLYDRSGRGELPRRGLLRDRQGTDQRPAHRHCLRDEGDFMDQLCGPGLCPRILLRKGRVQLLRQILPRGLPAN